MIKIKLFLIVFIFTVLSYTNLSAEINPQFTTQRHFSNPRYAGLSNTGVAIPDAVTGAVLNPSLVHAWHFNNETKYSASAAFERDSVYSRYIISTGASWYINEKTTIGTLYRNLKNSDDHYQNEVVLCVAGRLFDKSFTQGAVNLGFNCRFESVNWKTGLDSLPIVQKMFDDSGDIIPESTTTIGKYESPFDSHFDKDKRLLFDLGFFQDNIFQGLDFGLTFHNLLGFTWLSDKPTTKHKADTTFDTTVTDTFPQSLIDSSYHVAQWKDSKGRNKKVYKRMTVGLAYHANIIQNKVMILIPFDLEFIGLFDRKQKMKLGLHTGLEAWLTEKICLRFGYAYSPNYISGTPGNITLKGENIFSGGASARFEHLSFDIYIQGQNWGVGSTVAF